MADSDDIILPYLEGVADEDRVEVRRILLDLLGYAQRNYSPKQVGGFSRAVLSNQLTKIADRATDTPHLKYLGVYGRFMFENLDPSMFLKE